jgi:hypothetical protein
MLSEKDFSGKAALAICESMLLAMNDHKLLSEGEIVGILRDAAKAYENAAVTDGEIEAHQAVAVLINRIIAGGNSVRRPPG